MIRLRRGYDGQVDEFRLTRPTGLALRAACGSLSRSARLLIFEVTGRQILFLSFKNPKSSIINPFPPTHSRYGLAVAPKFVPSLSVHRRYELPTIHLEEGLCHYRAGGKQRGAEEVAAGG
jgi:hypothetical protein